MNRILTGALAACAVSLPLIAGASSHREAPFIAGQPKVDGTDFYMFRSYEPGRSGFVTFIANYHPLQDAYGGPNYFSLDPNALYEIHIDNNGDAPRRPHLPVPLHQHLQEPDRQRRRQAGRRAAHQHRPGGCRQGDNLNLTAELHRRAGARRPAHGSARDGRAMRPSAATPSPSRSTTSATSRSPNYPAYAANFIYAINIPGCAAPGRVFVGQRKDGFVVNLGEIFDLVNLNPVGPARRPAQHASPTRTSPRSRSRCRSAASPQKDR